MDDIASKLSQILNSPEGMEQLRSVAASLGLTDNNSNNSSANNFFTGNNNSNNNTNNQNNNIGNNSNDNNNGFDLSAISSILSGLSGNNGGNNQSTTTPSMLPNIDFNTIMRLQQAMSQISTSDKNVELLLAMKAHFGTERQKKVDDAIKIMQLIKLLPLIKESGIFGGGLF